MRVSRNQGLDVVRGVAIILAMGWHFNATSPSAWTYPGRVFGWAGVDLFFVLSGFLIGGIVFQEVDSTGTFRGWRFLTRRAARLWPVVWLYLAAQLIARDKPWNTYLFQNLLHVQNYTGSSLAHLWSLAVEEHFYLGLTILLSIWLACGLTLKRLIAPLLGLVLLSPLVRLTAVMLGVDPGAVQIQTHYRTDALAIGLLLAATRLLAPQVFASISRRRVALASIVVAGVGFLAFVPKQSILGASMGYTVAAATSAAMILLLYANGEVSRRPNPVATVIAYLGLISYSMYVWHLTAAHDPAAYRDRVALMRSRAA